MRCLRCIADLRVGAWDATDRRLLLQQAFRNGWGHLELLVHLADDSKKIRMTLPIGQFLPVVQIISIFRYLIVDDAMHDINRRCHLWELERDRNSAEQGLVGAGEQERNPVVFTCLSAAGDHDVGEEGVELLDLGHTDVNHRVAIAHNCDSRHPWSRHTWHLLLHHAVLAHLLLELATHHLLLLHLLRVHTIAHLWHVLTRLLLLLRVVLVPRESLRLLSLIRSHSFTTILII